MTFKLFGSSDYKSNITTYTPKDYAKEAKELLMVQHNQPQNTQKWKQFDTSIISPDDVVLLVDGDWLAFTSCAQEMKRHVDVAIDGVIKRFDNMGQYKQYLKGIDREDEYKQHNITLTQTNHPNAVVFAKASVKKKIRKGIEATGATKVIVFCGSTGNHRNDLPLPVLDDVSYWNYKGQRSSEYIPKTLPEVKDWMMKNWYSHWSVFEEADDSITVTKTELDNKGIKSYLYALDKDFLCERYGGTWIIGHQDAPIYLDKTEDNMLGSLTIGKTSGDRDKMTGRGDKFLAYQTMVGDSVDNYSAKTVLQKIGTLKRFGNKQIENYINQFNTRQELWQGVYDFFVKHLPEEFEYSDCFGNMVQSSPLHMLDLHFKCAKMREYEDHVCDVVEDRLKPLGVKYK